MQFHMRHGFWLFSVGASVVDGAQERAVPLQARAVQRGRSTSRRSESVTAKEEVRGLAATSALVCEPDRVRQDLDRENRRGISIWLKEQMLIRPGFCSWSASRRQAVQRTFRTCKCGQSAGPYGQTSCLKQWGDVAACNNVNFILFPFFNFCFLKLQTVCVCN